MEDTALLLLLFHFLGVLGKNKIAFFDLTKQEE